MRVLANSIRSNRRLTQLLLDGNEEEGRITSLDPFVDILCNQSSINATFDSNHTLEALTYYSSCPENLAMLLKTNRNKSKWEVARLKILMTHFEGEFDLAPFGCMNLKVLAEVLGWLGKESEKREESLSAVYRLLKNFPHLCGFPSKKKMLMLQQAEEIISLKARVNTLEAEIVQLKRENEPQKEEEIFSLKAGVEAENAQLKRENEHLRAANKRAKHEE